MMNDPKKTVISLCENKYPHALAIFWSGSVAIGRSYNSYSDLDMVIVLDRVQNAYREAFAYEGWKVDAFIHDLETLQYFFEEVDKKSGMPALPHMILNGTLMTASSAFSEKIKHLAAEIMEAGPLPWTQEEKDRARFFITDLLDDIVYSQNRAAQIASAAELYPLLAEFYFRAQNKWSARGKTIVQSLKTDDYHLASSYRDAFDELFKHGQTSPLQQLVDEMLKPYGGLLWEGYRADAPEAWRYSREFKT